MLIFFLASAWALPHPVVVPSASVQRPDDFDAALEAASGALPPTSSDPLLLVEGADGVLIPAERLLPPALPVPDKEPPAGSRGTLGPPVDHPGASSGFLSGKAIYGSQCHGWIWYDSLDRFSTQRGNVHDTVEDIHNPEGMNQYLFRYLENAGAAVFSARERDHNPNMAIADNDGEGYSESGEGFTDGPAGFQDNGVWDYGDDPFGAGTTRQFPSDGGAVASWVPSVPDDGQYAIYVSWDSDAGNASAAHYRIIHNGGTIDRWFDQRVHGSTWQYVETLFLPKGIGGLEVQLVGDSEEAGTSLSADAVRIGGGMGDVQRHGGTTGRSRHDEGAILYNQFNGAPPSVYDPWGDGDGSDPSTRSRWAAWEHPTGEDALYLSWHSNAFDGTARGTVTYIYEGDSGPAVTGSYELASHIQDELLSSILGLWADDWYDRGIGRAAFSEVSPYHNDEMPAALVELAFHDNEEDAGYLKEPAFRRDMSRAMYRGIVQYFAERDGQTPEYLPEPPDHLSIRHNSAGELAVSWAPGPTDAPFGDPATSYRVYTSSDGRSWNNGADTTDTQMVLEAAAGDMVFVRVSAVNAGGESFPTETIGARLSPDGWAPVLLVSAFDRLQASNLVWESIGGSLGDVVRMPLERVNPFDASVASGISVTEAGWFFDSVSDEQLESVDLEDYSLVIWVAGEESTADETFDADQQVQIRAFVEGGGAVWASGAEIGWDLDYRGDADDIAFANEVLGIGMDADDSNTSDVDGLGVLAGLLLDFGEDNGAPYPVEYPDVLSSEHDVIAAYASGETAAVLGERVAVFGFPFECIGDATVRNEVATRLLPLLVPDYTPPDLDETPADDGGGDDSGEPEEPDSGTLPDGGDPPEDDQAPPLEDESVSLDEEADTPKDKGCRCSSVVSASGSMAWVLAAMLFGVRRRG